MSPSSPILLQDRAAAGRRLVEPLLKYAQRPDVIVVAVPVAPVETAQMLRGEVDEWVCPITAGWFMSIGHWYMDFSQTADAEVIGLL